jgi:hypothetical protein
MANRAASAPNVRSAKRVKWGMVNEPTRAMLHRRGTRAISLADLPIQHVGIPSAICDKRIAAGLRDDLGSKRYRQLGVKERFKDQAPYRVCERCIRKLERREIARFGRTS